MKNKLFPNGFNYHKHVNLEWASGLTMSLFAVNWRSVSAVRCRVFCFINLTKLITKLRRKKIKSFLIDFQFDRSRLVLKHRRWRGGGNAQMVLSPASHRVHSQCTETFVVPVGIGVRLRLLSTTGRAGHSQIATTISVWMGHAREWGHGLVGGGCSGVHWWVATNRSCGRCRRCECGTWAVVVRWCTAARGGIRWRRVKLMWWLKLTLTIAVLMAAAELITGTISVSIAPGNGCLLINIAHHCCLLTGCGSRGRCCTVVAIHCRQHGWVAECLLQLFLLLPIFGTTILEPNL